MFGGEFTSSASKLAASFRISRDTWKKRAQDQQKRVKALDGKVRDLAASRDRWKQEAKELRKLLAESKAGLKAGRGSNSADSHVNELTTVDPVGLSGGETESLSEGLGGSYSFVAERASSSR